MDTPSETRFADARDIPNRAAVRRAIVAFVLRHTCGDFGEADPQQAERNLAAIRERGQVRSCYTLPAAVKRTVPVLTVVTDERREFTVIAIENRAKN